MTDNLAVQAAIARLDAYWSRLGCLIWLPHNVEVGAGTMNPATFLRVLGPEPWNVAYVEPSIRPDDARYGENPNRVGRHHQYQVILKPDPGNPQELYLGSLTALGVDLDAHDVRFVEDNWESPALGAWGLGWEVWLDGLEITQFTYFQQAGSLNLDPVSVEITYGLDRILMALQAVGHFKSLDWGSGIDVGSLLMDYEVDTSRYYFEVAHVDRLREIYALYETEAEAALEANLAMVAYDYVLKCSHTFNVLDARGAVGVTERAQFFGRMRKLAGRVAEAYVARREEEGFPLLTARKGWVAGLDHEEGASSEDPAATPVGVSDQGPRPFVLEVGTEELPVDDVAAALAALESAVPKALADARLDHGAVRVLGTPRRLAVLIDEVAPRQSDLEEHVVGPPAAVAFDADGQPTKAAEGFARSVGAAPEDLERVERGGEERVAAVRREAGRPAPDVLAEVLPELLSGLTFGRSMRWNASGASFSRPIRWLVALWHDVPVPFAFAGLRAGQISRGPRFGGSEPVEIESAEGYWPTLGTKGIVLDPAERRMQVATEVADAAEELGGHAGDDAGLVAEVANLVEQPAALAGGFDPDFLAIPDQVLVTVMKKHQRYFPVLTAEGGLMPHFVTVVNGPPGDADAIRAGNEAVLRARFADASFFWEQDRQQPLEAYADDVARLTFETRLGSMRDKADRLVRLVGPLANRLDLDVDLETAERAADLSKNDLGTSLVVEFTSLQGVMGREYALASGEPAEVAEAVHEQYLPRSADDALPESPAGTLLALADRLDTLAGLFAVGMRPTGTQDPYGLRRAALGLVSILIAHDLDTDLADALAVAAAELPAGVELSADAASELVEFIQRRLEVRLRDDGLRPDAVAAVLAAVPANPARTARLVPVLDAAASAPTWEETLTAYARCARIVRGATGGTEVDPDLFADAHERRLYDAVEDATSGLDQADPEAVLKALAALTPIINDYFDHVLVMDTDDVVRSNRLALIRRIAQLPKQVADLSHMEGF